MDVIAARRASGEIMKYGYECLFLAETSARPSVEFSLYAADVNSPDWRERVSERVQGAVGDVWGTEAVFYDPD